MRLFGEAEKENRKKLKSIHRYHFFEYYKIKKIGDGYAVSYTAFNALMCAVC